MQNCVISARAACGALVVGTFLGSSQVEADSAYFEPAMQTVAAGQVAEFDLYLSPMTLASFDAADVIIGSDDLADIDFEYSPAFITAMDVTSPVFSDQGFYAQDLFVSGFRLDGAITGNLLMGTVRAATTGLAAGDYSLRIDGNADLISALSLGGIDFEPIASGMGGPLVATVHIPEPATGVGFSLLALVCLRRRFTARQA